MVKKRRTAFKISRKNKISKRQTRKNSKFRKQKGGWDKKKPKKVRPKTNLNMVGGFWGGSARFYSTNN